MAHDSYGHAYGHACDHGHAHGHDHVHAYDCDRAYRVFHDGLHGHGDGELRHGRCRSSRSLDVTSLPR